ncbi:hypothetical protein IFO70_10170 [Phormidium tenue FACHB-886]|nr:hypothetical protein [Phormidium tenue FACHB-886]
MIASLNPRSTTLKPYSELRRGDEFECFFQKRWRRVAVLQKQIDDEFVELWLRSTGRYSVVERRRFQITATVAVFDDRLARPTTIERYEQILLELLPPGTPSLNTSEIKRRAESEGYQMGIHSLNTACRRLADKGAFVHKERARSSSPTNLYRPPLPLEPGWFVVEFQGLPSERYGVVEGWKLHRATRSEQPIVRWSDGSLSFSSDERLEPLLVNWKQRWVGIAIELAAGRQIQNCNLTPHLITRLLRGDAAAFRELHHLLKMPTIEAIEGYYNRNALLFWLENFYPNWEE